jgi:hypothetical protein
MKFEPVTDFSARAEVPGASVLPPHGRFDGWVIGRSRIAENDVVTFGAPVPVGRILLAVVVSTRTSDSDWREIRSLDAVTFQEFVRLALIGDAPPPRKLDVHSPTAGEATCSRYEAENDYTHQTRKTVLGLMTVYGKVCIHPTAPRIISLSAAEFVPDGGPPSDGIEIEMARFFDSLRFQPLGLAWRR